MRNLCIVIPTHERHRYLARCIDYYSKFDCKVIVCDSSVESYQPSCYANVVYYHLPGQRFAEKILFATSLCNTEFIALCPDDDFLFEDSLYKGAEILRTNESAQACVGEVIMFYEEYPFRAVTQPGWLASVFDANAIPEDRISKYLSNYQQVLWSLYRTDALRECFEIIREASYKNENFFELTIATICSGRGGVCLLDDYWILRELSVKEHWGTRHGSILAIKDLPEDEDAKTFCRLMSAVLFPGAGELALSAYQKTGAKENRFLLFVKKILKKFTFGQVNTNNLKKIDIDIDSDDRFMLIRKSFDAHFCKVAER